MNQSILIVLACFCMCFAQQATINIDKYKNSKKYSFAERSIVVGKHTFRLVNIKPLSASDTNCISAVVIDKRKYVLFDVDVTAGPFGLIVPSVQPISGGLIILKASPYDAKTFFLLQSGKVVTLPGASVIVDTTGKCAYCVWDNDKTFRLTVFDYKSLQLVIRTTDIPQPSQWFSTGMAYCFTTTTDKQYYTVDLMTKTITSSARVEATPAPVSYIADLSKIDRAKCCGAEALRK